MNRRRAYVLLLLACAGLALGMRLPRLALRPLHVDEAVHAYKFNELWQTGRYVYDPDEYHGPTLYYLTLPLAWCSGAHDWRGTGVTMYRLVPVLFGVGLILLLPLVADAIGHTAAVAAAVLTAVSHALVFYSRYYIQETLLVFFTFLTLAAAWRYVQTRRAGWALLAGIALGLMHATKETSIIAIGCALVAAAGAWGWSGSARVREPAPDDGGASGPAPRSNARRGNGDARRHVRAAGLALAAAIVVSFTLYSGFFTNLRGPVDAVLTYTTYFERAGGGGVHDHPWHYYLGLLGYTRHARGPVFSEALILGLGAVGIIAAWRAPSTRAGGFVRFLSLYAVGMVVVYAAIPYKTPWCALGFVHALVLLGGVGAAAILRLARRRRLDVPVALILLPAAAQLAHQAWRGNTRFCADGRNPYVYAHTTHKVDDLARYIQALADVHPARERLLVRVMIPNVWPLPWYLRDLERVGYESDEPPADLDADILIVSQTWQDEVEARLRGEYTEPNYYGVRRDDLFLLYVDADLRRAFVEQASKP